MPNNTPNQPNQPKREPPKINIMNMLGVDKPLGLSINKEQATLLIRGLDLLQEQDKRCVTYTQLKRDLDSIVVIWDRRIKNENLLRQQAKVKKLEVPQDKPLGERIRVDYSEKKPPVEDA